ncbi:MAG: UDP-N-acetylmuramoyl-L-alanine--D-glutamate ligase [Firmicutes bacterium HGW-Firmicutes-21]|nr:MAG: UDP-N-acetylmuramoyl-L-alanine--D-glutamate ligase [Firmicutes bacterium HGW-Firmicutes-21]
MLEQYTSSFIGKKVGFIGCGISNMPIVEMLSAVGIPLTVRDKKDAIANSERLTELGVRIINGSGYLDNIYEDVIFLSPAVRDDLPELLRAKENGTVLTTETEEFFKLCKEKLDRTVTIAVTGSDGKTTTTTLIAEILKASGKRVHIGGNIGKNLLSTLDDIQNGDIIVAELSSFQLMKMSVSPDIAVVTNVTPNHLDWHRDMEEYKEAKTNIFAFQNKNGRLVLCYDDLTTRSFAERAKGSVTFFSGEKRLNDGIYFTEKGIFKEDELILADEDIFLVGRHNRYNYAAAIAATEGMATKEGILSVAKRFGGVEHRLEFVRELDGVKYYNSSMDSSPTRTAACLSSFKNKVIIICGGSDKNIPLEPLGPLFADKAKAVILMGATAEKIELILKEIGYTEYHRVKSLNEAVIKARSLAHDGDCVVLSPAAASFDMFVNFAERGNIFKDNVNLL